MSATEPNAAEVVASAVDYRSHQRQYGRFLHLIKWFVIHMALLLPALYFFLIGGQAVTGTAFLVLALVALGYGIISTPGVGRDLEAAIESAGHPGRARR